MRLDTDTFIGSILSALVVGILGFGVNYARGVVIGIEHLNENLIEFKYEMKEVMEKLQSYEKRLDNIEKRVHR